MQKRLLITFALIVVTLIALGLGVSSIQAPSEDETDVMTLMTIDPQLFVVQTQIAIATPLSGESARPYVELREKIEACNDYNESRKQQMLQHIEWLIDPSGIPGDALLAMGTNVQGSLIFGMASFTSIEWRLLERPVDSCLVDIGLELNPLLEVNGRDPLTLYNE